MPTLILSLPAQVEESPADYGYALCADAGQLLQQGRAALSLLRQRAGQRGSVVGVVPASVLSWHLLRLPPALAQTLLSARGDNARRHALLAGALEEQLLDDPALLHFAVSAATPLPGAPASDTVALWVAAVEERWMRQTLQALEAAGLHPESLVPEQEPLTAPGAGRLVLDASLTPAAATWATQEGVWRLPLQPGTTHWLQQRMAEQTTLELQAEPEVLAQAEQVLGRSVQVCTASQRLLQAQASRWNLAQGAWAVGQGERQLRALRSLWRQFLHGSAWRPTRWALGALVLVQVLALNAMAWREGRAVQAQRQQQAQLLTTTFPAVQVVVDAPLQMRRELERLAQARGVAAGVDLAQALALLGAQGGLSVVSVELADGELQVRSAGVDEAARKRVGEALTAQGLQGAWSGDVLRVRAQEAWP